MIIADFIPVIQEQHIHIFIVNYNPINNTNRFPISKLKHYSHFNNFSMSDPVQQLKQMFYHCLLTNNQLFVILPIITVGLI